MLNIFSRGSFIVTTTVQLSSDPESCWNKKSIVHLNESRGHYVRCDICLKYPEIVKQHTYNAQIPLIATQEGVRYRSSVLNNHFEQQYHKESVKAERIKLLQVSESSLPMEISIKRANKALAEHVGKLLIQIYLDGKRLTLAAWNWPARYIATEASHAFSLEKESSGVIPRNMNLQYINPRAHLELMTCIVEADINALKTKVDQCLALSLRVDGSIDRAHIDKIYVLAKIVTIDGCSELLFFGVKEQVERLATGLLKTALGAIEEQFGRVFLEDVILKKISSICTDGTNVNSGEKGGIWAFLEEKMAAIGSRLPLLKVWCAAHRSDLAFNDLTTLFPGVDETLSTLRAIFFTGS